MSEPRRFPLRSACPLCGSGRLRDRFVVASFQITCCTDCTFVFVREHLTVGDLLPYYSPATEYIYADEANRANLNFYYRRLARLLERRGGPGRLLDVGCSAGQFLDTLEVPWIGFGVELSPAYAAAARHKHGARVREGTLADLPLPDEPFDVITFMDVLDHSIDPLADLERANQLLAPGGRVAVKVHNIDCLYARLAGPDFYALMPPHHLSYFSRKTLALALEKTGFELTDARFIGHRLALKTVPYRLAKGRESGLMYNAYRWLAATPLGDLPVYKNLHDIITVIGVKRREVPVRDLARALTCSSPRGTPLRY